MTRLSAQLLTLPWTRALKSAPTSDTSRVGSMPCSGTKTARLGCSRLSRTCVATRLISPRSKLMTPEGRIRTGSATPLISTSPLTPKLSTNGYTALSSGPTMSLNPRKRRGGRSSLPLSPLADGDPGGVDLCRKPARPRFVSRLPKPTAPDPARDAASPAGTAEPAAGWFALGWMNAVPLDRRSDPPTSGSRRVPLMTMSASRRPLYAARALTSIPVASALIPPWTSARATRPSHVSPPFLRV